MVNLQVLPFTPQVGSIISSAADLVKWDIALDSNQLLTEASKAAMWAPQLLNDGKTVNYGYGWSIGTLRGHSRVSHDGLLSGFRSYITRFQDDHLCVIILSNQSSLDDPGKIALGVATQYIPTLRPMQPPSVAGNPNIIPLFTGRYEYSNNEILTVSYADGMLTAHLPNEGVDVYKPISDSAFYCYDEDIKLEFVRSTESSIARLKFTQGTSERTIPRISPLAKAYVAIADPNPQLTLRVKATIAAFSSGGAALARAKGITKGARKDLANAVNIADVLSLEYIGAETVVGRKIERHGGLVSKVITYKMRTSKSSTYLVIYLTEDNQITDEDVVDE